MLFKRNNARKKGFSLVEVLIAIGILVAISVPLAMTMISTSQINTKTKNTSTAADLSATVLESMQSVKLSDLLTEVNGYNTNEYGEALVYSLLSTSFHGYDIEGSFEALTDTDGGKVYTPVQKNDGVILDHTQSSISARKTVAGIIKTYFTGHDDDRYCVVLRDVHNDESSFDIVMDIQKSQEYDLANINALGQSNVINIFEKTSTDQSAANYFAGLNESSRVNGSGIDTFNADYFQSNFVKEYVVTIQQDVVTEATNIRVDCIYSVLQETVGAYSNKYEVNLGNFSTNSTAEFASGIYLYYYPLTDSGQVRNQFAIYNQNILATSVYFVAVGDTAESNSFLDNYHPSITVYEHEKVDTIYSSAPRTNVCSNVPNDNWTKSLVPTRSAENQLVIKTLANISSNQTLYSVNVKVYAHSDASFANGVFTPNEKKLLIETSGSFLDTSIKSDIDSDKTTGLTSVDGFASAIPNAFVYDGEEHEGITGTYFDYVEGIHTATDAGNYTVKVVPSNGYTWNDGTKKEKTLVWKIKRSPSAYANSVNQDENGTQQVGVSGEFVTWTGHTEATNAGTYVAYATPEPNYAWEDGTYDTKTIKWKIRERSVTLVWEVGLGKDIWDYDGHSHTAVCHVFFNGELVTDCDAILENATIKEPGTKVAKVIGLSNPSYLLPPLENRTHSIEVVSPYVAEVQYSNKIYNGSIQSCISYSHGVILSGETQGINAVMLNSENGKYELKTYHFTASVEPGFKWTDGTTEPKTFSWQIQPLQTQAEWGGSGLNYDANTNTFSCQYDGFTHSVSCRIKDLEGNDLDITPVLSGNSILNVGETTVTIESLSNPNYVIPSPKSVIIKILGNPLASYTITDFLYDGEYHLGIDYDSRYVTVSGATGPRKNAGEYAVSITPKANYTWPDGTTTTHNEKWCINPILDAEVYGQTILYDGKDHFGVYGKNMRVLNSESQHAIGSYYTTVQPIANHGWTAEIQEMYDIENPTGPITVSWSIEQGIVRDYSISLFPNTDSQLSENCTYDSRLHTPYLMVGLTVLSVEQEANLNAMGLKVKSGVTSATDCDSYTFTLEVTDSSLQFPDGSKETTKHWSITQRPVKFVYSNYEKQYDGTSVLSNIENSLSECLVIRNVSTFKWQCWSCGSLATGTKCSVCNSPIDAQGNAIAENDKLNSVLVHFYNSYADAEADRNTIEPPTNAGTYYYKIVGYQILNKNTNADVSSNYDVETSGIKTITITKAPILASDFTAPSQKTGTGWPKTYTGSAVELNLNKGTWRNGPYGTFKYKRAINGVYIDSDWISDSDFTATAIDAGTYLVYWTIEPDSNHSYNGGTLTNVSTSINKATIAFSTNPQAATLTYTGSAQNLLSSQGTPSFGTMQYQVQYNSGTWSGWSTTAPKGTNAGTYKINYKIAGTDNWNEKTGSVTATINKATITWTTAPLAASITYDGNSHALLSRSATPKFGTVKYKVGASGTYSTSIPSRTNVGTYTVYYHVDGSDNWYEKTDSIAVTISKASPSGTLTVKLNSLAVSTVCADTTYVVVEASSGWTVSASDGEVMNNTGTNLKVYRMPSYATTITFTATIPESTNYSSGTLTKSLTVRDHNYTVNYYGGAYWRSGTAYHEHNLTCSYCSHDSTVEKALTMVSNTYSAVGSYHAEHKHSLKCPSCTKTYNLTTDITDRNYFVCDGGCQFKNNMPSAPGCSDNIECRNCGLVQGFTCYCRMGGSTCVICGCHTGTSEE